MTQQALQNGFTGLVTVNKLSCLSAFSVFAPALDRICMQTIGAAGQSAGQQSTQANKTMIGPAEGPKMPDLLPDVLTVCSPTFTASAALPALPRFSLLFGCCTAAAASWDLVNLTCCT
jgi:hypothetical protein